METKTMVICSIAVFFAFMDLVLTEDNNLDNNISDDMEKRQLSPVIDTYGATQDDFNELLKRGSLLRFGKRGSLLRFGKRGSLLRFGKRGSLLRFGKRYDEDMPVAGWVPSAYLEEPSDEDIKRSSLLRFGKKSALFRYGRSADNAPHTPFRFGRQEVEG